MGAILAKQVLLRSSIFLFFAFSVMLSACGTTEKETGVSTSPTTTSTSNISTPVPPPVTTASTSNPISSTPTLNPYSQDLTTRWLKGIPCKAPCWEGITPGKTTATEAMAILQSNKYVSNLKNKGISEDKLFGPNGVIEWRWIDPANNQWVGTGEMRYDDDPVNPTIYSIWTGFGPSLKLAELIQTFGNPSHAWTLLSLSEKLSYNLRLVYLNEGFTIDKLYLHDYGIKPIISPDLLVGTGLQFFIPGKDGFNKVFPDSSKYLVPWQGYQSYDFYCRDSVSEDVRDCSKVPYYTPG